MCQESCLHISEMLSWKGCCKQLWEEACEFIESQRTGFLPDENGSSKKHYLLKPMRNETRTVPL